MKKGWEIKKLAEVCNVKHGYAFDGEEFSNDIPAGNPLVITPGNFTEDGKLLFNERNTKRFSGTPPAAFRFDIGDLVVVMTDLSSKMKILGKPAFIETDDVLHNQRIGRVKFLNDGIEKRFVYYFMMSDRYLQSIKISATGTMVKHTAPGRILDNEILLPPLTEQQRIVAILDEAFDGIATAKANAEKNLKNARELFESHLQSVFTQRGDGWKETTIGQEIDLLVGFAFKSAQYTQSEDGVRLLRGDNIVQGSLRWNDVKRWPQSDVAQYAQYQLLEGDVVLAMDRPWVKAGLKRAQIAEVDLPCLLVQRTAALRGKAGLNNKFLIYLIGSLAFSTHILGVQTGLGVPHISGQQIKDFQFMKPPIGEQIRIVDKLDILASETQRLESIYQQKIKALDELKKSLLHKAFSGQL